MAMSSPTTVGAPSRAPFQATGTSNPTDSAESRKPAVVPMVHPHFPGLNLCSSEFASDNDTWFL